MKYQTIYGDIFTCEVNMLFSLVKISSFRAKAHLVFHWCLYNKCDYCSYRSVPCCVNKVYVCILVLKRSFVHLSYNIIFLVASRQFYF